MRLPIFLLSTASLLAQAPPTSIEEYLGLTPAQITEFVRNLDEYYAWHLASTERGNAVRDEIAVEVLRSPVDPMALGLRFAELETMQREFIERGRALIARHQSLLTPSQASRVQILIEASRLRFVDWDAGCLYLKENVFGFGGFCHFSLADATPASAKASARRATEVRAQLERFLQLTPDQITRYRVNQQEFLAREQMPSAHYRNADSQACEALSSSPLDPMRIGIPLARLATLTQQARQRARELIAANQAMLTSEQLLRLRVLDEARDIAPTASLAETEGFLRRADGQTYFNFGGESGYVAASGIFSRQNSFYLHCHP